MDPAGDRDQEEQKQRRKGCQMLVSDVESSAGVDCNAVTVRPVTALTPLPPIPCPADDGRPSAATAATTGWCPGREQAVHLLDPGGE